MSESSPDNKSEDPESTTPAVRKLSRRQMLGVLGLGINAIAGALIAVPIIGYILAPASRRRIDKELQWVSLGELTKYPVGQTRFATYRNPTSVPVGWRHRRRGLLGAADQHRPVAGVCDQLRASWLPCALVSAVGPVHVSVSRRRLLCRRLARLRPAAARTFIPTTTRLKAASFGSRPARCRPSRYRPAWLRWGKPKVAHAPD